MTAPGLTTIDVEKEFDRQLSVLRTLLAASSALDDVDDLREVTISQVTGAAHPERGRAPFVLVPRRELIPVSSVVPHLRLGKQEGFVSADTADIDEFTPIEAVTIPARPIYAIIDVDRGAATRNWTPDEAMAQFEKDNRSPLTAEEGAAFLLHYPEALEKNNCFQMPGSRCGDRRVPGIWISNRKPKLGFCWAGNRHTWLGIASCASRL